MLALVFGQRGESPFIDDEQVNPGVVGQEPSVAPVRLGEGQVFEQGRGADVYGAVAFAAGLVGQGAGDVALADAGGPGNEAIVVFSNPAATGQREHGVFVEVSGVAVVDVLDGGREAQPGFAQPDFQLMVVAFGHFPVYEEPEPLLKRKPLVGIAVSLLFQGLRHAEQAQLLQFVDGGLVQHDSPSFRP